MEIKAIVDKVKWRLMPILIACAIVAYIDRVNVSFAAATMMPAIGLSITAYGLGAGLFFIGYSVFALPSNLVLARIGARVWISLIMVVWGVVSALMCVARGETSYYLLRFLLGAVEAGFYPGILYYLGLWFPQAYRGVFLGYFLTCVPLSAVIGAPISGALLNLHGAFGLAPWQWMFVIEALPAILLGVAVYFMVPNSPAEAAWLSPEESGALVLELEREAPPADAPDAAAPAGRLWRELVSVPVLGLGFAYMGMLSTNYGLSFFLPLIVREFGLGNLAVGFVTALPFLVGTIGMVLWAKHSDIRHERRMHLVVAVFLGAAGLSAAALIAVPVLKMLVICAAALGIFSSVPVFWTLPSQFLKGTVAAAGVAVITAIGNVAGVFAPYLMGKLRDATGTYSAGLFAIAALGFVGVAILLLLPLARTGKTPATAATPRPAH